MHRDSQLERLAHGGGLHAGPDAAPEGGVEQNHVHRGIERVGGQLLEVHHHRVGGQRHAHHLPRAAHAVQAEDGIFQIIVAKSFDGLAEADGLFRGPHAVGVEAQGIAGKRGGQRAIDFQLVVRRKTPAFIL